MTDAPIPRSSSASDALRRKERISMAKEICSHRGENPGAVDRNGQEGWEKYEPLAGACIREAERLFALRAPAQGQSDCGITDAMCEAAVKADTVDRIQGFTYKTHHVIRDVWKPTGEQKVWEIDKNDADAEDKFRHQCRVERMRKVLEAALAASPPAALPAGETITDDELAGWARNWHWNDTAADQPVDPSIYFRDMRMLKAFIEKCRTSQLPSTEGK